jgi:dsRNA-specific ribonuclease
MALGEGSGRSKKQAETAAAVAAMESKCWENAASINAGSA